MMDTTTEIARISKNNTKEKREEGAGTEASG